MNKMEATRILREQLEIWRARPYQDLRDAIAESSVFEVTTPSGVPYQIEIEARWDDKPDGDILVIASIDDGGWRAFVPLTMSFIKRADGTCVGE